MYNKIIENYNKIIDYDLPYDQRDITYLHEDISYHPIAIRYFNELSNHFRNGLILCEPGQKKDYLSALIAFHETYLPIQSRYENLVWLYKEIFRNYQRIHYQKIDLYCLFKLIQLLLRTGEVHHRKSIPDFHSIIDTNEWWVLDNLGQIEHFDEKSIAKLSRW